MATITCAVFADISAPPATVYGIIADYHHGHPAILPPRYFRNLRVEAGGVGAGTRFRFEMRAFGASRTVLGEVTEPEAGRLVETYPESATVTSFLVEPRDGGQAARVTIATRYEKPGLAGWIERRTVPRLLRTIYREELANLAAVARGH